MHLRGRLSGRSGAIDLLSSGPVRVESDDILPVYGRSVTVASTHGDVDLSGVHVQSGSYPDGTTGLTASGDIRIEAWQPGSIFADGAGIWSSPDPNRSGSVRLLLHQPGDAEPEGETVTGFVLPRLVKLKLNDRIPVRSRLKVIGCLDVGPGELGKDAIVEIGGVSIFARVEAGADGRVYRMIDPGLDLRLKRHSAEGSCFKLRLRLTGDLHGRIDPDAELLLRIRSGNVEGVGRVVLRDGAYRLGAEAGTLVEPVVYPVRTRAVLVGEGGDRIRLKAGFATSTDVPDQAPDVELSIADFDLAVPSEEFGSRRPGVFTADAPDGASWSGRLRIDFPRGLLSLSAKGIDLGESADGDLTLSVTFDGETRAVHVVAVRSDGRLRY
jgi:hypothetical protein